MRVLFLCTGNSCRSQMAEGWARALKGETIEAQSAGIETHGLNPRAVRVMAEAGVDISGHRSKTVADLPAMDFDVVVTVCGHARESCPLFPGRTRVVHVGFDDPPQLAKDAATEDEALAHYRCVRDEIRAWIETLPEALNLHSEGSPAMSPTDNDDVREHVRQRYAGIAQSGGTCGCKSGCCQPDALLNPDASAKIGYSPEELAAVPEGANMGLGCGNPQAIAALRPGETVVDLGCGGGFDCFLAARRVGDRGRVIGVDMTPEMIHKARKNAEAGGILNVEFRLGEIEHLPVADGTADAIISNCVINLSPDKPQVFADAFRILRPGGRLAISDVVAIAPMPDAVKQDLQAHSGCIAGSATVPETERMLKAAGFSGVHIRIHEQSGDFIKDWFPGSGAEKFVRSATIEARRGGEAS